MHYSDLVAYGALNHYGDEDIHEKSKSPDKQSAEPTTNIDIVDSGKATSAPLSSSDRDDSPSSAGITHNEPLTISRQPVEPVSADGTTKGSGWCSNTTSNNADEIAQSAEQGTGTDGSSSMVTDEKLANDDRPGSDKASGNDRSAARIYAQAVTSDTAIQVPVDAAKPSTSIGGSATISDTTLPAADRANMSGGKPASIPPTASDAHVPDADESSDAEIDSTPELGFDLDPGSDTEGPKSSADSDSDRDSDMDEPTLGVAALSDMSVRERGQLNREHIRNFKDQRSGGDAATGVSKPLGDIEREETLPVGAVSSTSPGRLSLNEAASSNVQAGNTSATGPRQPISNDGSPADNGKLDGTASAGDASTRVGSISPAASFDSDNDKAQVN
ncbi:hypothetical protein IW152_004700, partial [Coemansia sp. BCRC 34962]